MEGAIECRGSAKPATAAAPATSRSAAGRVAVLRVMTRSPLLGGAVADRAEAMPTLVAGDQVSIVRIEGDFPSRG